MLRHFFRHFVAPFLIILLAACAHAATPASYSGPNGNWSLATNWSTNPVVPINSGPNTYDVTINGKTVTYNIAGFNTVQSLALINASLTLSAGDNLAIAGPLTATKSTITTSSLFSTSGSISLDSTNLMVNAGGSMSLPNFTSYTTSSASGTFQANGAAAQLILPALATINLSSNSFTARAQAGGDLEISALATFSGTSSIFEGITFNSTGANSILRANGLAALTMNGASITVQAQTGGYVEMTALASVSNSGSIFGNFNAYADGASAKLSLPALATISLNGANNTFRATAGGDLEVPNLATLNAAFAGFEQFNIQATGSGSKVNLGSSVTSFTECTVSVQTGGAILWGAPTSLTSGSITLDTSGTLNTSALANIDSTNLTASNGASLSLPAATFATTKQSVTWQAANSASVLQLPALTSISLNNNDLTISATGGGDVELLALTSIATTSRTLHLQTAGTSSKINLPALGTNLSHLDISLSGGSILWGSPTSLQASSIKIDTSGALNLAALTNIDSTSFNATSGASISLPLITTYSALSSNSATIQAGTSSTITLPALATVTTVNNSLTFLATGQNSHVNVNAVTAITTNSSVTFQADSGGDVEATGLASVNNLGFIFGNFFVTANDAGSKVNMPALTTIHLVGATDYFKAQSGGDIEMPALNNVTSSGSGVDLLNLIATGSGSVINFPLLFSGPIPLRVQATVAAGGTINWGNPTTLKSSAITLDTAGTLNTSSLANIDSTSLTATSGATLSIPVGSFSTLSPQSPTWLSNGASSQLLLPSIASVTINGAALTIQAQNGGTFQALKLASLGNASTNGGAFNAYADGAFSKLLLPALSTIHINSAACSLRATAGGDLEIPALSTITFTGSTSESLSVQSTGAGSLVNLSSLSNTVALKDTLSLAGGGEIDLAGAASPFNINFFASFNVGASGTLSVYLNHSLLAAISPSNNGTFQPFQVAANTYQSGPSVVQIIADGSGAAFTLRDYSLTITRLNSLWNGSSGNWSDASKWSTTPQFPSNGNGGINYDVTINSGSLNLDVNVSINNIILSAGSLAGSHNLSLANGIINGNLSLFGILSVSDTLNLGGANQSAGPINGHFLIVSLGASLTSSALTLDQLTLSGSDTIRPSSGASKVSTLAMDKAANAFTGKLDLTNNVLIVQASSTSDKSSRIPLLAAAITSASAGGTWTGNGITSSKAKNDPTHYALALFDNALLQQPIYGGQPADDNSLILTIAHLGDASANGIVDIQDQSIITNNWQKPATNWASGDLNLDGFVDIQDLTIVTNNWQQQSAFSLDVAQPPEGGSAVSAVPEPATLPLLALAPILLKKRRF